MQAERKRKLLDGSEYDNLIPKPEFKRHTLSRDMIVEETADSMERIIKDTTWQTAKIAPLFRGRNIKDTCRNIWNFVYQHIQYKLDAPGKEELREPARAWADRKTGVDCDCYTIFISTILRNLNIKHIFRIAAYNGKYDYQHVYPVAYDESGREIIIDCVLDQFNREEPYIKPTIEVNMTQQLSGYNPSYLGEADKTGKFNLMEWIKANPFIVAAIAVAIIIMLYFVFRKKPKKRSLRGCGCSNKSVSGLGRRRRRSTKKRKSVGKTVGKKRRRRRSKKS